VHRLPEVPESADHELVTVAEFAKRVHRSPRTIYDWIRLRQMPAGSVFDVHGHFEIDWTIWRQSLPRVV
jgi:hypothetical protein